MRKLNLFASAAIIALISVADANAVSCSSEDGGGALNGQCTTVPTKFIQTMNSMRLVRLNDDNTTTFVEVGSDDQAFDFASVTAGADVGNYLAGVEIPEGTYVAISPILDNMATVAGDVTVDSMYCRTTPSGFNATAGTVGDYTYDFTIGSPFSTSNDASYDYDTAGATEQYLNGDGDLVIVQKVTQFTVSPDATTNVTVEVRFDADEAIRFEFNGTECIRAELGELDGQFTTTVN